MIAVLLREFGPPENLLAEELPDRQDAAARLNPPSLGPK